MRTFFKHVRDHKIYLSGIHSQEAIRKCTLQTLYITHVANISGREDGETDYMEKMKLLCLLQHHPGSLLETAEVSPNFFAPRANRE
jgi:hypothetical protein